MPFARSSALRRALGLAVAVTAAVSLTTTTADAAPSPTPTPATPTPATSTPATSTPATPSLAPPPLPGALTAAQEEKEAADQAVARADARIAAGTRRLHALSARADRAAAAYSAQVLARQRAAQQTQAATAARAQAQAEYDRAHARFVQLIRSSVEQTSNPVADFAYLVFTADSPGAVLDALQLGRLASENSATVVGDMDAAVQRKAAAEEAQHAALAEQDRLTTKVAADKRSAEHALAAARDAVRSLRNDLAAAKRSQAAAVAALSQALGGWSLADPAQAAALNARYRTPAANTPAPKNPGHWTPALGQYAASRALAWIGTPYAWAGGNATGPTRGVCAGGGAANDCRVVGFDCSGLALHGWAPFLTMPHLASTQYSVAGSTHPAIPDLRPGDLVFWSTDGKVAGIHHVAIYIGEGNVVQAPQSGDIVRVTPLASVDRGYFGATRPLT